MPTQNYLWNIPAANLDPWYDAHVDMVNAIDASVSSVALVSRPRTTAVLSFFPSSLLAIHSATGASYGADGYWTVCSAAPYGRLVGSFSLVGSGAYPLFQLMGTGFVQGTYGNGPSRARFRLVVQRTGVSSLVIPSNSGWYTFRNTYADHSAFAMQAVASLGPGNYSAELQAHVTNLTGTGSHYGINNDDYLMLTMIEASRAT